MVCRVIMSAVVIAVATARVAAQTAQTPADGALLYDTRIRPILETRCLECHGADPERAKSGLSLASRGGVLRGGSRGPAIDTARPDRSLILRAIGYADENLEMPPSGRLPDDEIAAIKSWLDLGAPFGGAEDDLDAMAGDGDGEAFTLSDDDRAWWSVGPLTRPAPPAVADTAWPASDIDRFILARLEAAGLAPASDASKRALIRRATYDLTGLPPAPEDVEAFVADDADDAFARLVDRLLASPQYGVKWGRHWLDLVRFAETDSYERDRLKPGAWRYRDWVIDALNADLPYDEFLVHQLAGDELPRTTAASIVATGYMRLGIWDDEPTDTALAQYDDLDSILDTTSRVMLGMSMGCARCHDHKGDPIPQQDYYRMLAFFRGIAPYKVGGGNATTPGNFVDRIPADLGAPDAGQALAAWRTERAALLDELRSLTASVARTAGDDAVAAARADRDRRLVAHYAFEDTTPLVARDAAGDHPGRVEDVTVGVPGVRGRAFRFDGSDDSVRIDRTVADDFTISAWFRTTMTAPGGTDVRWFRGAGLVDGEIPGIVDDFGVSLVGDGYVTAGTGNPETFLASGAGYNDDAWHHVVFTRERESGAVRLYVDGEPVAEATGSKNALDRPAFLEIGRMHPGHGRFAGDMDEVRIYGRALDGREVLDLFLQGGASEPFAKLVRAAAAERADRHDAIVRRLLAMRRPQREMIEVLRIKELPAAPETRVLIRGNPHAPAGLVTPGVPRILDDSTPPIPDRPAGAATSGRRLALARWIADPANRRTSRVMANRLWQYHFGRGLVPTPNDFGFFGRPPTHPALLDWLATEFVARGWSMKAMHRLIMNSRAYRMASTGRADALAADPENDLRWRFDMRRLTAEEVRDTVLAASGTLNLAMGGPGVYPPMPEEVLATASRPEAAWGRSSPEDSARRSVYIHVKRSLLTPLLTTMDLADTDATCPVRFVTTQPTQALTMLNSDFMNEQAALFAARVAADGGGDLAERVGRALERVLGRPPATDEIDEGVALVHDLEREEGFAPGKAFASYCLVLLNLNEFMYLD